MKLFRYSLLAASLLFGLASCDKANDPEPESADTYAPARNEMDRMLYYPASSVSSGVSYAPADVKASGRLTNDELRLNFGPEAGQDEVSFVVPAARLTSGLVGTYALRSMPTSASGIADVSYTFTLDRSASGTSGRLYLSNANRMEGDVTITAYDQRRRLISGTYTMKMDGIADPYGYSANSCNLTLNGSFKNLPLQ